eukprot:scaffold81638_cov37-Tisochrysis_lutea.AAC.1
MMFYSWISSGHGHQRRRKPAAVKATRTKLARRRSELNYATCCGLWSGSGVGEHMEVWTSGGSVGVGAMWRVEGEEGGDGGVEVL